MTGEDKQLDRHLLIQLLEDALVESLKLSTECFNKGEDRRATAGASYRLALKKVIKELKGKELKKPTAGKPL